MTRVAPVFDVPIRLTPELQPLEKLLESLRDGMGRLVPILDVCHITVNGGLAIVGAGSPGTTLNGSRVSLDLADPRIDSVRFTIYGQNSTATGRVVQLYDVTNSVALASVTLTNSLGMFDSGWQTVNFVGGNRAIEVRVIGNGADTQTLYSVHSQYRTARFQQR